MKEEKTLTNKLFRLSLGGLAVVVGVFILSTTISIIASFIIGLAPLVAIAIVAGIIYFTFKK